MSKTRSIALAGLMCSLHIIATIFIKLEVVPGIELAILFFVPFLSAIFAYRNNIYYSLIYLVATLLVCGLIDLSAMALYILPTIVVGFVYGELVKNKLNGNDIVYILTFLEFGLFFLGAYIIKLVYSLDMIELLKELLHFTQDSINLGLGFLLVYSFSQAFLVHIVTKYQLKKLGVNVEKANHPSFINLILAVGSLVAIFFKYSDTTYQFLAVIAMIVFCAPIILYGYQATDKPWIILIIQAVFFLVATLPLLKVYNDTSYQSITAYLMVFVPPLAYGAYIMLFKDFVKKEA